MTKDEFITKRTEIIENMLDNPQEFGIYSTSKCFARLDDLYDKIIGCNVLSDAQKMIIEKKKKFLLRMDEMHVIDVSTQEKMNNFLYENKE